MIMKHGKLPDNSKCEAFLDGKRVPGGDRTGFPDLPEGKLSLNPISFSIQSQLSPISFNLISNLMLIKSQFTFGR